MCFQLNKLTNFFFDQHIDKCLVEHVQTTDGVIVKIRIIYLTYILNISLSNKLVYLFKILNYISDFVSSYKKCTRTDTNLVLLFANFESRLPALWDSTL